MSATLEVAAQRSPNPKSAKRSSLEEKMHSLTNSLVVRLKAERPVMLMRGHCFGTNARNPLPPACCTACWGSSGHKGYIQTTAMAPWFSPTVLVERANDLNSSVKDQIRKGSWTDLHSCISITQCHMFCRLLQRSTLSREPSHGLFA